MYDHRVSVGVQHEDFADSTATHGAHRIYVQVFFQTESRVRASRRHARSARRRSKSWRFGRLVHSHGTHEDGVAQSPIGCVEGCFPS